ncbi:MAG: endonuclease III [Bdellovibrionales bacterium RIFOXYB1_FULL_37_110]|nr:MAG: endonuclease III [Bdellovibrionales bacterium RIFOXYA1_FULL_38_20]OFZ51176.1 MAG: endonuclease III [Bdellovibrionales bacterium RIFOXYC1_FULL_37_79]OFZ61282.1 MAG: endonuclease III [Bdellovibrionales bacterium RIFOXYB1_FULL_37_110]OFZ62145.1 MAG: endonuclease III [Bdellovibrionales bacterium RIFOXYD1_FULL_36_51]
MNKKNIPLQILKILKATYPDAKCELHFNNNFELLIATILSAQCTDVMVNKVTPLLFNKYPDPDHLAKASAQDIEKIIKPTGFYKNKAKNILATSVILTKQYSSQIPNEMSELIQLPGVGRKTANVVLSNGYGINVGIVVDTHVKRISTLLKLTTSSDPTTIENDLIALFPKKDWGILSHLLIAHGRKICMAKKPRCFECPLNKYCYFPNKKQT